MDSLGGEDITISIKAFLLCIEAVMNALMALPLRHARSFIGNFQRMVKNRSRQLLTENIPENNLLTLMFAIMCLNEEATGYTK